MLNELDIKFISRDPQVVAAYQKDPLVHTRITPSMGYEMMQAASWLNTFVGEMPVPTLLFHGTEDGLTSHLASSAFAHRVQGPLKIYRLFTSAVRCQMYRHTIEIPPPGFSCKTVS